MTTPPLLLVSLGKGLHKTIWLSSCVSDYTHGRDRRVPCMCGERQLRWMHFNGFVVDIDEKDIMCALCVSCEEKGAYSAQNLCVLMC